jgi:hypothetical protein
MLFFVLLSPEFYLGKRSESQMMEERDEEMRNQYHDPIENFPDKIDQLMNALDRVCDLIFF